MTKKWSSVRSNLGKTKRQASKERRRKTLKEIGIGMAGWEAFLADDSEYSQDRMLTAYRAMHQIASGKDLEQWRREQKIP